MKNALKTVSSMAAVLSLSVVVACGDDEKGGGSSGVSSSKTLSELTDDDAVKLCQWSNDQAGDVKVSERQLCTSVAVFSTTTKSACEQFVKSCVDSGQFEVDDDSEDCSDAVSEDIVDGSCDATVKEWESCIKASVKVSQSVFGDLSCDDAGKLTEDDLVTDTPKECEALEDKCPGILDDEDDIGGGGGGGGGIDEIECPDGSGSLIESNVCDGFEDCDDGSDEEDC